MMYEENSADDDNTNDNEKQQGTDAEDIHVEIHGNNGEQANEGKELATVKPTKKKRKPFKMAAVTVAGEKPNSKLPSAADVDIQDRDPEHINDHLKLEFHDIFAEPHPSIFSFDFIWKISFKLFEFIKLWTYRILTLIFGIPVAILWAIYFGIYSFIHIWCLVPVYRAFLVKLVIVSYLLVVPR